MTRYVLALCLFFCVSASGQQTPAQVSCEGEWCRIHIEALKLIIAESKLNCGPWRATR